MIHDNFTFSILEDVRKGMILCQHFYYKSEGKLQVFQEQGDLWSLKINIF